MNDGGPSSVVHSESREHPSGRRLSHILFDVAPAQASGRISVGDLLDAFGNRAYGALIFIFAAPNVLPVAMPGVSAILGAPLLFLTWQLAAGRANPWLPALIRNRSLVRRDFERLIRVGIPWLQRIERMIRPRLLGLTEPLPQRLVGVVALTLATIIFLPIPLGNVLPGFALALLALGILERDGIVVLAGLAAALAGVLIVAGVVYGLAKATIFLIQNALGI